MEELLNSVNAEQEPVVEAPEPDDLESVDNAEGEETQETPEAKQEVADPVQTPEQNELFKKMRLRAEAEAREAVAREAQEKIDAEYAALYKGHINEFTQKPILSKADHEEYVRMLGIAEEAKQRGVSFEEQQEYVERLKSQIKQEILTSDPDLVRQQERLKQLEAEKQEATFKSDLEAIKKAYPDEKATSVFDLGEEFLTLMSTGCISALSAYEVLRKEKEKKVKVPVSTGDIKTTSTEEKDFYTPEEVDRLTAEDYDKDPKLMERVRRSMLKWK